MADINTLPQVVNIDCPAGDTLTLQFTIAADVVAGRDWTAQVRPFRGSTRLDAEFTVVPGVDDAWNLVLSGADTESLGGKSLYEGWWDVQLSDAGADPITTLAVGEIRIHPDVSRYSP